VEAWWLMQSSEGLYEQRPSRKENPEEIGALGVWFYLCNNTTPMHKMLNSYTIMTTCDG